ncbi:MAG TPA: glycosyltransferase 87 family protein [Propionicimonas sp.]|uniref:glycosyltransferase 87 family protein n=1 Tax=Propionicimonas sp. TaxID=1955623 RepID=UPI002F41F96C
MRATTANGPRVWILAAGLTAVAVAVGFMLVFTLASNSTAGLLGDLDIYRGAVSTALAGQDLYSYTYLHPTVHGLGFTYPPFAALVLVPFALLASAPAKVIWTALTFVVTLGGLSLLVRSSGRGVVAGAASRPHQAAWVAGLSIPVMLSYPFLHNLVVGQVSLFVIALALFDHLLPRRWQGSLVGIAAAIKLTPLVFVPYYLVTRQWRQAATCVGTFVAATAIAWLVLPAASLSYWTDKLWQTGRVGRTDSTVNKSLLGLLARQLPDGVPATLVWLVVAAAVGLLAYWQAARHLRDGSPMAAALAVGALSVAVSPISWPHHQLWLVFAACWYVLLGGRTATAVGAVLFVIFLGYPWFDDYPAGTVGTLLGIGVELPALAVLLVLGVGLLPGRSRVPVPAAVNG